MNYRPRGVIAAPVTPFDGDGRIDMATLTWLCEDLVATGVHAIALPLHTGESLNLSVAERKLVAETAIRAVDGRVPVLIHVSMPGTREVIELAQHAEDVGAAAVISVTPYHWQPGRQGLVAHYQALSKAVTIGVLAYNFPARLGVALTADVVEELVDSCPNFVGVKDASYDMQSFTETLRRAAALRSDFAMLIGVEYLLASMPLGGAGCFSPSAAIAGDLVMDLWHACEAGDLQRAKPLQYRMSALWHLLRECGYPASVKAVLALQGHPVGGVRLPLVDPDPATLERLRSGLLEIGVLT